MHSYWFLISEMFTTQNVLNSFKQMLENKFNTKREIK